MTDDPFLLLVCDALGLMSRPFTDPGDRQSYACEFYHQFRKFWDRGIPVGMGLGHILLRGGAGGEFFAHRLGENGRPDEPLAVIGFLLPSGGTGTGAEPLTPALDRLASRKTELGCPTAVAVVIGTRSELADLSVRPDLTLIRFDTDRWTATPGD